DSRLFTISDWNSAPAPSTDDRKVCTTPTQKNGNGMRAANLRAPSDGGIQAIQIITQPSRKASKASGSPKYTYAPATAPITEPGMKGSVTLQSMYRWNWITRVICPARISTP